MFNGVDAEFTSDVFLGSGALDAPWYSRCNITEGIDQWTLVFYDPIGARFCEVSHADILGVVLQVALGAIEMACQQDCLYMLAGGSALEFVDFDDVTADWILQQCAFGTVTYS